MISRRSALQIARAYQIQFRKLIGYDNRRPRYLSKSEEFHSFLFEREYDAYICNLAEKCFGGDAIYDFIRRLHTGESISRVTPKWTWQQRRNRGQTLLRQMAEHYIQAWNSLWLPAMKTYEGEEQRDQYSKLIASLELDGYSYLGSKLLYSERDVLDSHEEQGILSELYGELNLQNRGIAFRDLNLSDEHYMNERWEDSIANCRKFLECVAMQVAAEHSRVIVRAQIDEKTLQRPVEVREYLETQGLLDAKEKEALAKVYGLLSHTGSHPNMAAKDQARLLRQLSLTFAQFIMLRFQGTLSGRKV